MPTELNTSNFGQEVLANAGTVLVDFYTQTCSPCRAMAPILEEVANERGQALKIVKVDAAQNYELAAQFKVLAVPTFILFKNGQPQKQFTGMRSKKELMAWIDA